MLSKIPYTKPSITALEEKFVGDAVRTGWGNNCYSYINKFENDFADYMGVKYAVATSSCTGALHLGLSALGIGPGDNVIIADTNWIASVAPIVHLGAKPIFVDIESDSWCIDAELVEKNITNRTKAIIAVHLYGNSCEMNKLQEIGKKYSIPIIEDAAEAIGSIYQNQKLGSLGLFGTFSFHGTKTMTTGEGGMFVTNDQNIFNKVKTLSNHGRDKNQTKQFWSDCIGFKYKMSNLQAAIGCAQLMRIEELVKQKRKIFNYYYDFLSRFKSITFNYEDHEKINGYWMPTIVFDLDSGIKTNFLIEQFSKQNIDARVFFWPLSKMPMFTENQQNVNSYSIYKRAINLPSYHDMTHLEQDRVLSIFKNIKNLR